MVVAVVALSIALQSVETFKRFNASTFQRSAHQDSLQVAESLLIAGDLRASRSILERLEDRSPNDVRVLLLLGRVHLAWPTIGRFAAESLFMRAGRLAPDNPEPFYWLGHVGLKLGGDDGEMTARRGLLRVLALNPEYRDTWILWNRLYAGRRERLAAAGALSRHQGRYLPDLYRAQMLLDAAVYDSALPLLASLAANRPGDVRPRALRARALFELGRDNEAWAAYGQALALAAGDTDELLWRQVRSTASPAEREIWERTAPADREAFLRVFWARREPDLFTGTNERIGEHFRRMVDARRDFRLLHPNSRYHRSLLYRSLMGGVNAVSNQEVSDLVRRAQMEQCTAQMPDSLTRLQFALGHSPRVDTAATEESPNLEDGLDDRGRVWVRHGRPTYRMTYGLGAETWCYVRRDGVYRVTFVRRTGPGGASGEMVFTPVLPGEANAASLLMASDRTATEYRLDFVFWPATFRGPDAFTTDVLLFPDSARTVALLVDQSGRETARDTAATGPLRLRSTPGRYLLLLDASRDGRLGSYRGPIPLPDYGSGELAISSLLVASGEVTAEREAMAAAAPYGLRLPASEPMRFYAELYGLGRVDEVSRYEARYRFERLDGGGDGRGRETVIGFQREMAFSPRIVETLVVDPGRLAAGRYRLRLEVIDQVRGTAMAGSAMEFRLR